mmetsp:Transcript_1504/g.3248  ORF Transcript_1504/g.3248 Transcript_1504/m.3248 type:complete len:592 (-) Transcript_1504:311-2086(-)|eukprot:CAMPEP_0194337146 /NCGR_PEP_ID=MMETSP0171-20130528/75338_1 /TAXON_ID=218684 /ORGANISM="Corethron pennatum, Strain L29A3" /LENGTH=591 /DNA_ID=CAMNT_0039100817 /DNA_START=123 /DNA_END=1898 /DNA_ORIENTATION=-
MLLANFTIQFSMLSLVATIFSRPLQSANAFLPGFKSEQRKKHRQFRHDVESLHHTLGSGRSMYSVAKRRKVFQGNSLRALNVPEEERTGESSAVDLFEGTGAAVEGGTGGAGSESALRVRVASFVGDNIFLGIAPTPEILAIATIYFVEGALGLAGLAQTFLLKDELSLGPAEVSALGGLFILPWTVKPIYGFLSDAFPLFGYRRRSYLVLAGLLGCFGYAALGQNFWGVFSGTAVGGAAGTLAARGSTISALVLASTGVAISDVVADGIVVERTRDAVDPGVAGGLQSLCWGSAAVGGLVSSYFGGSLLEIMTPRDVFSITAVLPLLVAGIALLIDEEPTAGPARDGAPAPGEDRDAPTKFTQQTDALWSAIKEPTVWKPALFMFLWQATPSSGGAFFYFMTNDLNMGPEFLGRAGLVSSAASLLGIWCYQKYLCNVAIKDILIWGSVLSIPLGLSDLLLISHANRALGIPDGAFVFGSDAAASVLGEIGFLPVLVLAARICPPGVEAVLFATLMSLFNGSSVLGTEIGAVLTSLLGVTESNFENLGLLTLICTATSLVPLLFLGLLDDVTLEPESQEVDGTATENTDAF